MMTTNCKTKRWSVAGLALAMTVVTCAMGADQVAQTLA